MIIAALLLSAHVAVVPVRDFDIPWFEAHPKERADQLGACHTDARTAESFKCRNAEAAAMAAWGKERKPVTGPADLFPHRRPVPAVKGAERGA